MTHQHTITQADRKVFCALTPTLTFEQRLAVLVGLADELLADDLFLLAEHRTSGALGEGEQAASLLAAVEMFLADYDDGDRAEAGCTALMEAHVAAFRDAIAKAKGAAA